MKSAKLVHHILFQMLRRMDAIHWRTVDLMTMCFIMIGKDRRPVCHAQIIPFLMQLVENVYPFLIVLHLEFLMCTGNVDAVYPIPLLMSGQENASRPIARKVSTVVMKVNAFPVKKKSSISRTFKDEDVKKSKAVQHTRELQRRDNVSHVPSTSSQYQRRNPASLHNVHRMTLWMSKGIARLVKLNITGFQIKLMREHA